ncbi:MAG: hypothetical protein DCC53_14610 [Chloroflexi bacterium]|nr:MAG: hypothetical protein DCC53_14610 [Chloroflexota bacterium]
MTELVTILGMALVTFGVRYITLALVVRAEMSPAMKRALRYVPVAVLSAITVPAVAAPQGIVIVTPDNAYLYAGIITALIAWRTKSLLLTIVLGLVVSCGARCFSRSVGEALSPEPSPPAREPSPPAPLPQGEGRRTCMGVRGAWWASRWDGPMNLLFVSFVSFVVQSFCSSLSTHHLTLSTRRSPHPRPLSLRERGEGRVW